MPSHSSRSWATASLRVSSTKRSVAEIVSVLNHPGTRTNQGKTRDSHVPAKVVWVLQSSLPQDRGMEEHLAVLLEFAESRADALRALLPDCRMDIFCGFSSGSGQGGFSLSPQLLRRLADLPLTLGLDLYPPGPLDEAETTLT